MYSTIVITIKGSLTSNATFITYNESIFNQQNLYHLTFVGFNTFSDQVTEESESDEELMQAEFKQQKQGSKSSVRCTSEFKEAGSMITGLIYLNQLKIDFQNHISPTKECSR
jgi:pyruvate formate-lyase activating enzyme-like uncharacterized protein